MPATDGSTIDEQPAPGSHPAPPAAQARPGWARMATMHGPSCADPGQGPHAWERLRWLWHLVLPVLLGLSLAAALGDGELSGAATATVLALSAAMVAWYLALRPDRARDGGHDTRAAVWGLGSVLLWLPLVLVHPAFFLVLTALFTTLFSNVDLRAATWLAGLLGLEIAAANLRWADPTPGQVVFTVVWTSALVVGAVAFARWIHGIIDQSRERHDLIAELESTRADLAAAERTAGVHQERARLTGEIHDTLAQSFTSVVVLLQSVEARLPAGAEGRRQVELAIATARDGLADARRLIADLDPAPLDAGSLPDAVRRVAGRFADETGVATAVEVAGEQRKLPPTVEVALLRAAQESLANVRKHASAGAVQVSLRYDRAVTLQVRDDGAGFDPAGPTAGFGLRGMRERLATVDGRVDVESEPGHGTRVLVAVP